MWRTCSVFIVLFGLFLAPSPTVAQKSYSADSFDVSSRIEEGGSLRVEERISFRFQGGPFTYVFRELPLTYNDGIIDLSAGVNGESWPAGSEPGQVEISGHDPVRITWHLPETSDAVLDFDLSYRMLGAIRQENGADVLCWRPLPDQFEYGIDRSEVIIDYPQSATLLPSPGVVTGNGQITSQPGQVTATSSALAPNSALEIELNFAPGSLISNPPAWQQSQIEQEKVQSEQDQQGYIWLLGSGLLLLLGTAGAIMAVGPYRRPAAKGKNLTYSPPDELAPAITGLLRTSSGTPSWSHAQGTLFDLARRGLITIEESGGQKWYQSRDFTIRLLEWPAGLWPHEQALLELIFYKSSGARSDQVKLSALGKMITSSRWKIFSESLKAEVKSAGLWSKQRESARQRLIFVGFGFLALTIVSLAAVILLVDQTGFWSLSLMVTLALLSIVWIIAGSSIMIWSDAGSALAGEWEPFYRYLKNVARGKAAPGQPDDFELYLPYAASYGYLHQWAKSFEKKGWSQTPAYFQALEATGQANMGAFVAMTAATASSGGSAAGASAATAGGTAGAAGGGASGAG